MNIPEFHEQLENLLKGDTDLLVSAVRQKAMDKIEQHNGSLILFGSGELGHITLGNLLRLGKSPVAIADNNPKLHGTVLNGVPIMDPAAAHDRFPDALFVVAVYTSSPVKEQLDSMRADWITFAELAWSYPDVFLPRAGLELPGKIFAEAGQVRATMDIWADDDSRREYLGQLGWRTTLDPALLPPHLSPGETYFPADLFDFQANEVFVDCGAFDGDSIRAFLLRRGNEFQSIIALEPDPANRELFQKWLARVPAEQAKKIRLEPYALGEQREKVFFNSTGTMASVIGSGGLEVECMPLDDVLGETLPSYIKMDIEGAEPYALRGAANTIHRGRPILAVCLYHAQEHLWRIPLLIHALEPGYRLFLRRHSDECWEIMCYAIPEERCKS